MSGGATVIVTGTIATLSMRTEQYLTTLTYPMQEHREVQPNTSWRRLWKDHNLTLIYQFIGLEVTRVLLENYRSNVVAISRTTTPDLDAMSSRYQGNLIICKCDVAQDIENKVRSA